MMTNASASHWQPLSTLPLFSDRLDSKLEDVRHQYRTLLSVQHRPHIFDKTLVERIITVYTEHQHFLSIYKEHAIHWMNEAITYDQQAAVEYFNSQIHQIGCVLNQMLSLTKELAGELVEEILAQQRCIPNKEAPQHTGGMIITKYFQHTKFMYLQKTLVSTLFQTST
jgi:hypothetical protein